MADQVVNHGKANNAKIWTVFASSGAWATSPVRSTVTTRRPVEDFSMPPATRYADRNAVRNRDRPGFVYAAIARCRGRLRRTRVRLPRTTTPRSPRPTASYTINGIVAGTYPSVFSKAAGFDRHVTTVSLVSSGANSKRLDDAPRLGRHSPVVARVAAFNGPDFTYFGCGPSSAIDQSLGLWLGQSHGRPEVDNTSTTNRSTSR